MQTDALPSRGDNGGQWTLPVVLALLVHLLVALVFIAGWLWSPKRSMEAAAGDPAVEASLEVSAAEASAARRALKASQALEVPEPVPAPAEVEPLPEPEPIVEDTVPPPQPLPEPRPQDAPTPQQHNAQERIAQPDTVDQERVSALAISQEKAKKEQEAKRRQEQIDLTERKRVEEAEQKLRLAKQQEEADRQKKLADEQRKANEAKAKADAAKAEAERQQKIAELRRKREQAEREAKAAQERLNQVTAARNRAQAAAASSGASGTPQASPGAGGTSDDLLAKYGAAIQQAILNQWVRPDSIPRGQRCRLTIRQLPGGDVVDVEFSAGCPYDDAGRRSVEAAVLRARPLPYRGFESVFQRTLTLNFEAQDR